MRSLRSPTAARSTATAALKPLFAAAAPEAAAPQVSPIETRLKALNVDELSPPDALQVLYEWKGLVKD